MKYGFDPNDNGRQILEIDETVMYFGEKCIVCFKHDSGLINLKRPDGFYHLGVHPNMCKK